jgi:hypothetical protein
LFELKITAGTIEELLAKASALGALGVTVGTSPDVPLPEPKLLPPDEPPKARRGRSKKEEPEEAIDATQEDREPVDPTSAASVESAAEIPDSPTSPEPSDIFPPTPTEANITGDVGTATIASHSDIPEHMLVDSAPDTIEQAQAELDAGGPEDEWPEDFREFTETVDTGATSFTEIKKAQAVFFNSETFKTMAPEIQNRLRANIWTTCIDRKEQGTLTGVPDVIDDVSAFRLALETWHDPEAISGTYTLLQKGDSWSRTPPTARETIDKAVQVRLGAV